MEAIDNGSDLAQRLHALADPSAEAMADKTRLDELVKASGEAGDLIASLLAEIGRLEAEVEELRDAPWPRWALEITKKMESYGVSVDPFEGWDLPVDLDEWLSGALEAQRAGVVQAVINTPCLDDDGYICEKQAVLAAISEAYK